MKPIKFELPEVANEALTPLARSIGTTLSSIWDMCFGWVDISAEKVQYRRQLDLKSFKDTLDQELSKIPEDKLCEPKLSVVGPAIEASKYFFEDGVLRTMFAKLIASSMNSDLYEFVQNSFVDVIKQMSPFDAILLNQFGEDGDLPILQIVSSKREGLSTDIDGLYCTNIYSEYQIIKNSYYYNSDVPELIKCNSSLLIDDLLRLGLAITPPNSVMSFPESYKSYEMDPYISDLIAAYEHNPDAAVRFLYRAATLTDYGKYFVKVCL